MFALPPDWTHERIEAGATAAIAFFTFLTTVVALLVYMEARAIRKTEWFAQTAENWQSFNRLVIESDYAGRWSDIINGRVDWVRLDQKDMMFIYSFLNVLVFEFNARDAHLLDRGYAEKSIKDNIRYFRHIWPGLRTHLSGDGWPEDFLPFADAAIEAAEIAEKAVRDRDKNDLEG